MKPFYAYLLRCADGSFYAGHTDHLETRIGQHQIGGYCAYTKHRRPVTLAWSQDFPSRIKALEAEQRIKGWSRAKKEALVASDWGRLSELARSGQSAGRPSTSSGRTGEETRMLPPPVREALGEAASLVSEPRP